MEFKNFLTMAFHAHEKYISLMFVQQSLLIFVCTIPSWLVEEIMKYVLKIKDFMVSKGVVEVTVDDTVIFNVVNANIVVLDYFIWFHPTGRKKLCSFNIQ